MGVADISWEIIASGGPQFASATLILPYAEQEHGMEEALLNAVYRARDGEVTTPEALIDAGANSITISGV